MSHTHDQPGAETHRPPIGWALYLGVSWTWVIGMLLPALLVRDYGLWGYLAFLLPNVLGAAGMGWLLSRDGARRILETHAPMVAAFGVATVAFHAFVAAWLLRLPAFGTAPLPVLVVTMGLALFLARRMGEKGLFIAAGLGWMVSIGVAMWGVRQPEARAMAETYLSRDQWLGLAAFTPAAALGFLASPYLDPTFLQARAALPDRPAKVAFGFGFGVVFLAMVLFSLAYSRLILPAFGGPKLDLPRLWALAFSIHLPVQMGLTMAWHGRAVAARGRRWTVALLVAAAVALLLGVLTHIPVQTPGAATAQPLLPAIAGQAAPEWLYRSFLLLYGTVFPAYVVLCMWPTKQPADPRLLRGAFLFCAAGMYPLAWGAFVTGRPILVVPCALLLAVGRMLVSVARPSAKA